MKIMKTEKSDNLCIFKISLKKKFKNEILNMKQILNKTECVQVCIMVNFIVGIPNQNFIFNISKSL